jgi:hypothetical protein
MASKEQLNRACAFDEVELLRRHIHGRVLSIERMRVEFHHIFSSIAKGSVFWQQRILFELCCVPFLYCKEMVLVVFLQQG